MTAPALLTPEAAAASADVTSPAIARPTEEELAPAPVAEPAAEALPAPPVSAPAAFARMPAPGGFQFDEQTVAVAHPMRGPEISLPGDDTPLPPAAEAALARVETPPRGMPRSAAPLRTPPPFLDAPGQPTMGTPGPVRRGLPPPIPAAARSARPEPPPPMAPSPAAVPTPLAPEPSDVIVTQAPAEPVLPAPSALPWPGAVSPAILPTAPVSSAERRQRLIVRAVAGGAIAVAVGLAVVLLAL